MAESNRLRTLRVGDVMSRTVVAVWSNHTMAEAADTLIKHNISGAPVVDEQGHCVGVLSAADFVLREQATNGASSSLSACEKAMVRDTPDAGWHIEDVFQDWVCGHMSPAVQTVDAETPLVEAGRMMCAMHIHRLPVLDERRHPVGVVTSLDIVSAMVNAMDEAERENGPLSQIRSSLTG